VNTRRRRELTAARMAISGSLSTMVLGPIIYRVRSEYPISRKVTDIDFGRSRASGPPCPNWSGHILFDSFDAAIEIVQPN
jgi:hypothetical protein